MTLTPAQLFYLGENLSPSLVSHRKVGSTTLSYMEAWSIKATLIRIFGFAGFSSECIESEIVRAVEVPKSSGSGNGINHKVTAKATVKLTIHQTGAIYQESAIADGILPDWTEAADAALKSAESDALKRCAIFLGTQFGLSLYNDGSQIDVIGPVWAPDQIGLRDQYIREMQEAAVRMQQQQQAQMPPAVAQMRADGIAGVGQLQRVAQNEVPQDPYLARVAAGLKVDERDGPGA